MFNFIGNIKLKSYEFWIYDGCHCDHHVYKFSNVSTGFVKIYDLTHLILLQIS